MYATASFAGVIAYFLRPRDDSAQDTRPTGSPEQSANNPDGNRDEAG